MIELGYWPLKIRAAAEAAGFRIPNELAIVLGNVAASARAEGHAVGLQDYPNWPGHEAEAARIATIELRKGETIGVVTARQIRDERTPK